jgi:glycosyltransferase involved in cell wall biosynthesis
MTRERFAVDIVINNFNYGRFLSAAIESALAQTHNATTIIVVDDGSTDESVDVIRSFGDKVIAVFKENGGQASALNAGFACCAGRAVIFLDADDLLASNVAARVASIFANNPSLARVQYRMEVIDGRGTRTGIVKPAPHLPLLQGDLQRHAATFPFDVPWTATSGNSFSTRVLRRIFPIPEEAFRLGADWYLLHLTPLLGPVASLDSVGAYYRVHGSNNYELAQPALELDHVRQTIAYAEETRPYIETLAAELAIPHPRGGILSVSAIANRLVSLRLEPERHTVLGDTRARLTAAGVRASMRRFDVAWPMKALFIAWFITVAVAPRWLARGLSERFLIQERRQRLNRLLGALHRSAERTSELRTIA